MNKREIGWEGESQAAAYLTRRGYKIIERNYMNRIGEIDIIAVQDNTIVFIEVKWRRDTRMGNPAESVLPKKQMRIARCAMLYVQKHRLYDRSLRFDIIEIIQDELKHMENAFMLAPNSKYL